MTKIGLLSDTHGFLNPAILNHFEGCDEIWHAGDFGNVGIAEQLKAFNNKSFLVRGVFGNVDGHDVRNVFPEKLFFTCEKVNVYIKHIGGYPQRYTPGVKNEIIEHHSKIFISGHSHILKVMFDKKLDCLHLNPGAAGRQGWQKVSTVIRFAIDGTNIINCEVIEL